VEAGVGLGAQQQIKVVALEDLAEVRRLQAADGTGECECALKSIDGPADVFGVVDVAVEVNRAVRDSEPFGFGVGFLRLEPFEICRDCLWSGMEQVQIEVRDVSGALGAFLEHHPFAACLEEFAAG